MIEVVAQKEMIQKRLRELKALEISTKKIVKTEIPRTAEIQARRRLLSFFGQEKKIKKIITKVMGGSKANNMIFFLGETDRLFNECLNLVLQLWDKPEIPLKD